MQASPGETRASRAVDDLYRAHAGEVFRYAYAMLGNRSDAEDVTQTTFINAMRALERGDQPLKPSNWLITITHNIVRQRFRQQQARPAEVELDYDVVFEEAQHDGPSTEELVRALQRIPPAQRAALVMRELEGRSYKEIESILDTTAGALETLLFRARRSLAEELENLVTCERAELAMSRQIDGRLKRKERRRLDEHLEECGSCARLYAGRARQRRAFGRLALLPLPFSLTFFKGAPTASAASGLSTIGTGGATAAVGVSAACGTACATGGFLAGGFAIKTVAVVAAATMAGSVGYEGVQQVRSHAPKAKEASSEPVAVRPAGTPALPPARQSSGPAAASHAAAASSSPGPVIDDATTAKPSEFVLAAPEETPSLALPAEPEPTVTIVSTQTTPWTAPAEMPTLVVAVPPAAPAEPQPAADAPHATSTTTITIALPPTDTGPAAPPTRPVATTPAKPDVQPAPVYPAPVYPAPVEPAPVEPAPVDTQPTDPAPADPTPTTPTDPAPAPDPTPSSTTPTDPAPTTDPGAPAPLSTTG